MGGSPMHTTQTTLTGIRRMDRDRGGAGRRGQGVRLVLLLGLIGLGPASQAADFTCPAGDGACLIDAITTANANGEANTITMEAGTYTLTTVHNDTDGPNGLPSVTSTLTITGVGAETTSIERQASAPAFRLMHVGETGSLTLGGLTLKGGGGDFFAFNVGGGGIRNSGTLTLTNSTLSGNSVLSCTLNDGGGGIANFGTLTLTNSTLRGNSSDGCTYSSGGGIFNSGSLMLTNSTLVDNHAYNGGGLFNHSGTLE